VTNNPLHKQKLFTTLLVTVLLLSFFAANYTPVTQAANALNGLHVEGAQLLTGANETVIIKGVVTEANRWLTGEDTAYVDNQVQMMKAANITFVNVVVATGDIENGIIIGNSIFWANLQRLCAQTAANDMGVVVTGTGTHWSNTIDCHYLENYFATSAYTWSDWVDWWELYATNLAAYTNVIFDLFREPLCSEETYVTQMQTCIDAIRVIDPDRVCNVEATGTDWQYLNFNFELNTGIQRDNILFSIDAYAHYASSYAAYAAEKHMDDMLAAGKCVWFSEFNGCTNAAVGPQTFDGSMQQWEEDLINDGIAAGIDGFNMWSWDAYVAFGPVDSTDGWNFSYDIENGYLTTQGTYLAAKYGDITNPTPETETAFGYDAIGGTEHTQGANYIDAVNYQAPTTGNITTVSFYCKTNNATGHIKIFMYSDNTTNNSPNTLLATSNEVTVGTSYSWVNFTLAASVTATQYYHFGWMSESTVYSRYDAGSATQWHWKDGVTYPTPPNPFNTTNNPEPSKVSLYASYNLTTVNTYTIAVTITWPINITYTSQTISYSVYATGNDTASDYQINLFKNGLLVGTNKTTETGSFGSLTTGSYTFGAYVLGTNGASTYESVDFSVIYAAATPSPSPGGIRYLDVLNVQPFWQYLNAGNLLGFFQSIFLWSFIQQDILVGALCMLFLVPIYIKTRSLLLLSILWILLGGFFIVAMPAVSGLAVVFLVLGIGSVFWKLVHPN